MLVLDVYHQTNSPQDPIETGFAFVVSGAGTLRQWGFVMTGRQLLNINKKPTSSLDLFANPVPVCKVTTTKTSGKTR